MNIKLIRDSLKNEISVIEEESSTEPRASTSKLIAPPAMKSGKIPLELIQK